MSKHAFNDQDLIDVQKMKNQNHLHNVNQQ